MTFLQMQQELGRLLNEDTPTFWTTADRIAWLNQGQYDFMSKVTDDALPELVTLYTANTVAGTQTYALPTDFLRIKEVSVGSVYYRPIAITDLKAISTNAYYAPSSVDSYYYVRGGNLVLYPTPTSNGTNNISIIYSKNPAELSADGSTSDLPEQYHHQIVLYALVKAMEKEKNTDKALAYLQEYHANIQAINQRYLGYLEIDNTKPYRDQRGKKNT